MTAPDLQTITARLRALQHAQGVSPRIAASCAALAQRLGAPVRIGLFGLPGAGKLALLDALAGSQLAGLAPLPTLELGFGDAATTEAMLPDGTRIDSPGMPGAAMLARDPAFLRVTAPLPGLRGRRYLLVVCEADPGDFAAALAWAAPRVDIALWCARGWSGLDAQAWGAAPETLCNHAALVLTGEEAHGGGWHGAEGFEAVFRADPAGIARHLDETAAEAAAQDIAAAEWMLQRHGIATERASTPARPGVVCMPAARPAQSPEMPAPSVRLIPALAATAPDDLPDHLPEARAELSRLFHHLRNGAAALAETLPDTDNGAPLDDAASADVLHALGAIFDALTDRVADLDRAQDCWPDLAQVIFDAQDMALLLRMEGGAAQAADAARLLLQLRHDMEDRLAA